MNANNLSLYGQMQAMLCEMEGMKAANLIAVHNNEGVPYDELDFQRIGDEFKNLSSYTTAD